MTNNDLSQTGWTLLIAFAAIIVFMGSFLIAATKQKKLVIVDTAWGLGFVVITVVSAVTSLAGDGDSWLRWILLAMVAIWGLRLARHLHSRNAGKPEDPRYVDLIEANKGSFATIAVKKVFAPQGIIMWIVGIPIMVGVNNEELLWWWLIAGLVVWAVGIFFETVGDAQLAKFKSDPDNAGKLMDQGLWRYTRHPNYFGDSCVWWGIWLVAAGSWAGFATIIGPIAMTFFLVGVTGAKLNEKSMSKSKPGYADYVARTSGFIPMPPKRRTSEAM